MKRFLTIAVAASLGIFMYAGSVSAATGTMGITTQDPSNYTDGMSANGVVQSRHNLGFFGGHAMTFGSTTGGTTQVCVFCHTPHHTNTDAKPLWNRSTVNSSAYKSYGSTIAGNSTVIAGSAAGSINAGSVSIACLSCHDGVTALDSIVNAPGNGGVTTPPNSAPSQGWSFFDEGTEISNIGGSGNTIGFSSRVNLGTDLTNDHPVNIVYNEGTAASLRPKSTNIAGIDLTTGLSNTSSLSAYYKWMTQNRWANLGFIDTGATIQEMLRTDSTTSDLVECSSCHDPHFSNKTYVDYKHDTAGTLTGVGQADGVFLRRVGGNTGSGVCRTCHDK
ncbi:MAG: hypothetical protein ACE5EB_06260 [Thermodesulfobacteriota bacterium]